MQNTPSNQQYNFIEEAVEKARQDAECFLIQTLEANKGMYGYSNVPTQELLKRVRKGMSPAYDNYYEYWLDGGSDDEVFVACELVDLVTLHNGKWSIGQVLSELPLRSQRAVFNEESVL